MPTLSPVRGLSRWDVLAVLLVLGLLVFLAEASRGLTQSLAGLQASPVSLEPAKLPWYAARTTLRMLAAMVLSLLFTFTYATGAARSRRAERVLVPLLDILQSVPILGFISVTVVFFMALAPGRVPGAELAAVFAIFTSQAWNMAFSFYQSLRTVPAVTEVIMHSAALLEMRGVRRSFPKPDGSELLVLDGVELSVAEGEIVGLLGRSGSGKSTLLRLIAGLAAPTSGRVSYLGQPVSGLAAGIAMVFQGFALFPWLTVFAELEGGDIRLTDAGQRFAVAPLDEGKTLFRQHLLNYVPLAAHIRRVLDERASHTAPRSRFLDELEDHMTDQAAEQTLDAVVGWGRYAEAFAYDDRRQRFSLDNPA